METYAVVGLGYVGLGLAIAFSKKSYVIAYDNNKQRIKELKQQVDRNNLINKEDLVHPNIVFTDTLADIKSANLYIVAVATPAYYYEFPNLEPLIGAVKDLGVVLKKNDTVVFESTVYPGATEEICIPLLEKISKLTHGKDFNVGYSPERINPGDEQHTLQTITKIISAENETTLKLIQGVYETICDKIYPVSSIKAAESIKLLENIQRDVNIALMNEFSKIMHALDLDMHEIIEGAKTKWGFMPFKPGFVGGHCISIDPLYLAFKAKQHAVQPDLILTARKINDGMTQFIIQSMLKLLVKHKLDLRNIRIGILGLSYKENVVDLRNSLTLKLIKELRAYGFNCSAHDPLVHHEVQNVTLNEFDDLSELSVVIITVGHDFYREVGLKKILSKCKKNPIIMDIPNLFIKDYKQFKDLIYWNL
jgi:UDP-N-acetyl-D-galactosamine dehydrogenase